MAPEPVPERLSLLEAIQRWCDQGLVDAVKAAERQFSDLDIATLERPRLMTAAERDAASVRPPQVDELRRVKLDNAWDALIRDFKAKLERRQIYLRGVTVSDEMNPDPRPIDGSWASIMILNVLNNSLKLRLVRHIALEVSSVPFPLGTRHTPDRSRAHVGTGPQRGQGRPRFPIAEFVEIAKEAPRASNNKRTADVLRDEFRERHPDLKLPAVRTVTDHVVEIYQLVEAGRTALKP
jgi:hypothetical protein